ncbi:MAG: hypothetical protein RR448_00365 [Niameybacter sp.]
MLKKFSKVLALGLAGTIALTGCSGGKGAEAGNDAAKGDKNEPTVIRIGSHAGNGMNPDYKDPITGEYSMSEMNREITIQAMQKVKDELNVQIEWVQFPGDTTEVLLQSVMAGDPVADIVNLYANSQGIILGQNVLQPLDDYMEYFAEGSEIPAPIYGKQYFIEVAGGKTHPLSPLFYNIDYIEQVDALKENGKTIYPTDLYKDGKWTWSVFEDYLAKINAHYANSQGPERPEKRIDAYRTDYTETLIQAMHSAGGSIYGDEGLGIESEGTKQAVAYVEGLINKGLLQCDITEGTSNRAYNAQGAPFDMGESVFVNIEDWRSSGAAAKATERGQSLGFIPFPRPDHMAFDDPNYRQVRTGGESWAVLRGVDEAKIPLAIQTYQVYNAERSKLEKEMNGGADEKPPIRIGIDLFHEEIGADMQDIYYSSIERTEVNELSNMTGVYWDFMKLAGDSIYGVDGSPSYEVAVEARKATITDKIAQVEATLNSTEVKDNIAPAFTQVEEGKTYAFAKGTDPASIDWASEFTVADNIDGKLDAANVKFDSSATDFNTVGLYSKGVVGTISDSNANEGKQNINITIFDDKNTTAPTLTMKEELRTITVGEESANINWANDFVEVAIDKDGLDLKAMVVADLSEIDTTTAGTYNVTISVTDYAGNETAQTIEVQVVAE